MSKFQKYLDEMCGKDHSKDKKKKKKVSESINEAATVHTNPQIEDKLRKVGFDIPKYPKQGDVTLNGEKVGRMDNFNGLMIFTKDAIKVIKKAIPKVGIWNEGDAK